MKVKVKKLNEQAILPTSGSTRAAGYDLYSLEDYLVDAGHTHLFHTGLSFEIPEGYFGAVFARSGLASKRGLRPANCVGVIDSDYRGELMVSLHNDSLDGQQIRQGERIAQLVILPYLTVEFEEVSDLSKTEREAGGFGSTGQ